MLQFILGPAHAGKTDHVYQELKERLDAGLRSWILVPEQFSLFTEKEIIARFGLPAQKQIKVLSFARLCNLVLHRIGPLRMQYMDGAGKHMVAARSLELLEDKLIYLKRNLHQKGFAKILAETFSECKRYGVSPQALQFAAGHINQEELSAKLDEVSLLFETYNQLIEAHHADAEDNLSLITPQLRNFDFLEGKLFVLHFRSFTPVEHAALGELMHRMDISVTLDYTDDTFYAGIFSPVATTIRRLRKTAEEQGIDETPALTLPSTDEDSALAYLSQKYFDFRAKPYPGNQDHIVIMETQNRYREIQAAADLILRLCRTQGYRFRDFLVLARGVEPYSRILPAIFESRGVSVFLDARQNIGAKPLIRLLSGTLEILAYGHSYERIMTIARAEIFPLSREEIDQLENYILATAPSHAMWQEEIWDYQPGHGTFDLEKINHTKNVLLSGVKQIENTLSGRKTGGEIAAAILDWMKESDLAHAVTRLIQNAADTGNPNLADEYQQVWNAALSILSQLSAIMQDTPMTYRRFSELFQETCAGTEVGRIPQTLDAVIFSQIDRFRSSGAKVVLVLDLNEGVFPKGYNSEGFFSDNERHILQKLGLELAPGMETRRQEEQLLLYAVLSAPQERLFLLRGMEDNNGNPLQPSGILKRVQELCPQVSTINPDTSGDLLTGAEGGSAGFSLLAAALSDCGGNPNRLDPPLLELYTWFRQNPDYQDALRNLEETMTAPPPEQISKETAAALYGAPLMLSASQLETYNGCAFRYFLTYGLLLRERELAGMEPKSMGSIQHAALYRYFTDLKKAGTDFTEIQKEDCFKAIGDAVDTEARENSSLLYETSAYYQYIVLRMKDIAARTAWEVVKFYRSSRFRPYGFEVRIGKGEKIPALSVKTPSGEEIAKIKGIIDRADTAQQDGKTLISIVDYKSSAKDLNITLAKDGITLQPLLYSGALCNSMEDATPAAMFYLQMTDPVLSESDIRGDLESAIDKKMKPKGWIVDDPAILSAYTTDGQDTFIPKEKTTLVTPQEIEERIRAANQKIQESAMGIAGGNIGANPYQTYQHDACAYCQYHGICQKEQ